MSENNERKGNPIIRYFQESFEELRKVTWPTRNQAVRLTFIVIGFCIVFAAFIGALDLGFNRGYQELVKFSGSVSDVASNEPTPITIDPSSITITPATPPATPAAGSTQQ